MSPGRTLGRVATAPARAVRGAWRFANPKLKAGRIPYGRTILALYLVGALVFVGYTLAKKQIHLPFVSPEPYYVQVELPDAAGLDPSKEPAAGVAGASAGRVVGVTYEGGKAIATLRLDPDMEGKIFADATASLRPINVLQVLIVNIDPGDPATGPLPEDQRITTDRTDTFVNIDELTSILDADTQAQVQILISEAARALKGREPELRSILAEVGDLTETAKPVAAALRERRGLLTKLTGDLDTVFTTLGTRGSQLGEVLSSGSRVLEVTTNREAELTEATRELAPTVEQARTALAAGRRLAEPLNFTLDQLLPVADQLQPAADKTLALIPQADAFLDLGKRVVADAARPVTLFERGTRGLADRVQDELIPAVDKFRVTIDALDKYKGGIAQTADLWSGAFSTNGNGGPYSQVYFGNAELTPEGLGLSPAAARARGENPSKLATMLARALEITCRTENEAACSLRFALPELPTEPVTGGQG
jgi:phospholipid/cholesterol/gamma-HCH transport system substrate-binding protein